MSRNLLFIFTDEHQRDAAGCYGHPLVKTPNLDALAARGTVFDNAYTPSPICVPARASLATGRYVHELRTWSNAEPYHGQVEGWGHRLQAAGYDVLSIGKLHFRSSDDPNGFQEEILPLHVRGAVGWTRGLLIRGFSDDLFDASHFAEEIGPGDCSYSDYDRKVGAAACDWLRQKTLEASERPWALFVSFLRPHYPMTCPADFYDLYDPEEVGLPDIGPDCASAAHPVLQRMKKIINYDDAFTDESRKVARASYYGLCSFVDDQIGQVLGALEESGCAEDTAILYSSDHGEANGARGFWTKMTMFEESAAVPMILAGPDIPQGRRVKTPVSLVDVQPTLLELAGVAPSSQEGFHGRSLLSFIAQEDEDRAVLSEYHDGGAVTGIFMIRVGSWKYVVYPGYAAQLFNLDEDPKEQRDLAGDPAYAAAQQHCHERLLEILDPEEVNRQAFADQAAVIARLGGVEAILSSEDYDFTPVS